MKEHLIIVAVALIIEYALSWGTTVGIIKLITLCFHINFSLLFATGIWLALCLVKMMFHSRGNK